MSSFASSSTVSGFPVGSSVILHGLVKGEQYNGKTGVVRTALLTGRQQIFIEEYDKTLAIRPGNLRYQPKDAESLSVSQLKVVLKEKKKTEERDFIGMDKSELVEMAKDLATPTEIAEILAIDASSKNTTATAPAASSTGFSMSSDQIKSHADRMSSMNPEQMRQQARMMRSMDPATLRRMNPQMANLTDDQIKMAADQMEAMADNPAMMKMAAEQMKNMSPQEMENIQRQGLASSPPSAAATTTTTSSSSQYDSTAVPQYTPEQLKEQANQMSNMSPDQLRKQAQMIRSMDTDTIRRMNPQMANMSDHQIQMAANQMEAMAENPDMLKMASDQMKNLSPEDMKSIAKMQNDFVTNGAIGPAGTANMADALSNMDPKQVKNMMKMMKENPSMMKDMMKSQGANVDDAQVEKTLKMMESMDEEQLEKVMKAVAKFQKYSAPIRNVYTKVNGYCGGHLLKLMIALFLIFIVRLFIPTSNSAIDQSNNPLSTASPMNTMNQRKYPSVEEFEDDEF